MICILWVLGGVGLVPFFTWGLRWIVVLFGFQLLFICGFRGGILQRLFLLLCGRVWFRLHGAWGRVLFCRWSDFIRWFERGFCWLRLGFVFTLQLVFLLCRHILFSWKECVFRFRLLFRWQVFGLVKWQGLLHGRGQVLLSLFQQWFICRFYLV